MNKRTRNIAIGATLLVGGVAIFGFNRRKKLLYKAVVDKIDEIQSPYTGVGDLTQTGETCAATDAQIETAVNDLIAAMGGPIDGTDEDTIYLVTEQINTKACWNKVDARYREKKKKSLYSAIQKELKNAFGFSTTAWEKWEKIYEQLK